MWAGRGIDAMFVSTLITYQSSGGILSTSPIAVSALFQFHYSVEHVLGVFIVATDALSRDNLLLFSHLLPQALPSQVPPSLLDLLLVRKPDWGSPLWIVLFVGTLALP